MRRPAAIALVALLVSCGKPAAPPPADTAAQTAGPTPRLMSDEGAGPISADTRFDQRALEALLPGAQINTMALVQGGRTTQAMSVLSSDMTPLFEIHADSSGKAIASIEALGGVVGPAGEKLGAPFASLGLSPPDCQAGSGRHLGQVVCKKAGFQHLTWIIGVSGWSSTAMPPAGTLSADGRLSGFLWTQ